MADRALFTEWLARHREGLADVELRDALSEVVAAVALTGKAGSLTLTLKVTAEGDAMLVLDTLTAKIPEERQAKIYYVDLAGNLTRNHPLQPSFPDAGTVHVGPSKEDGHAQHQADPDRDA